MEQEDSATVRVVKSIFVCIFITCAVIGNGSVLYAIQKYPKLKTVPNLFVFNLALSDFLFGLTGIPMILITTLAKRWVLGNIMCNIGGLLNSVFLSTSIWTLVMISMHRYFAVAKAIHVKAIFTRKRAFIMIFGVWLWAFAISLPPLLGWSRFVSGTNFCTVDGKKDKSYGIFLLMTNYFFPLLFLTILYARIFFLLREHEKVMKEGRKGKTRNTAIGEEVSEAFSQTHTDNDEIKSSTECSSPVVKKHITNKFLGIFLNDNKEINSVETNVTKPITIMNGDSKSLVEDEENQRKKRHISFNSDHKNDIKITVHPPRTKSGRSTRKRKFFKEVKVTKMLLIVVCGFFLCWTPFVILAGLYAFDAVPSESNVMTVGIMFACLNSIINPIIYAVMNQNFRFAFKSMYVSFTGFFMIGKSETNV